MKLFGNMKRDDKSIAQAAVEGISLEACLLAMMQQLDLSRPVWLPKHERAIKSVGFVQLRPADFIEPVAFDVLELQLVQKKPKNPKPQPEWD